MNCNEQDSLASNSFIPLILQSTKKITRSNTLTDNVFSNVIKSDIISSNLTATIFDHLLQFAIISNFFGNILGNEQNIYEKIWSKFDLENFILDHFSSDWENLLKTDAPLKRINECKLKFKSKSWITLPLQKSISVKNKLLVNSIRRSTLY